MFDNVAGWVAVPEVLDETAAAALAVACTDVLDRLGLSPAPGDKVVGGTQHLADLAHRVAGVAAILDDRRLVAVVEEVLGGTGSVADVAFRNPRPRFGGQRLHADAVPQPRHDSPATTVTAIVALTAFTSTNGATRVVPGSHRRPDLQRQAGALERHPDEILLTGPAGTAFVFSGHLLHSGTVNTSDAPRPSLQIVWRRAVPGSAQG